MNSTQKQEALAYAQTLLLHLKHAGAYASILEETKRLIKTLSEDNKICLEIYHRDQITYIRSKEMGNECFEMEEEEEEEEEKCKNSYIILYALQTYLLEKFTYQQREHTDLQIKVSDLHVFNVLDKYLTAWKQNTWMASKGPIPHVELMEELWELLHNFHSYNTVYDRSLG